MEDDPVGRRFVAEQSIAATIAGKVRSEERLLAARFGHDSERYWAAVPMLAPRWGR